jgi:hypothetical protein
VSARVRLKRALRALRAEQKEANLLRVETWGLQSSVGYLCEMVDELRAELARSIPVAEIHEAELDRISRARVQSGNERGGQWRRDARWPMLSDEELSLLLSEDAAGELSFDRSELYDDDNKPWPIAVVAEFRGMGRDEMMADNDKYIRVADKVPTAFVVDFDGYVILLEREGPAIMRRLVQPDPPAQGEDW